jgi:hypothetical protein
MNIKVAGAGIVHRSAEWVERNVSMVGDGRGYYIANRNGVRTVTDRRVALDGSQYAWADQSLHTKVSGEFE